MLLFLLFSFAQAKDCTIIVTSNYHSGRIEKDAIHPKVDSQKKCVQAAEPYKKNHFKDLILNQSVVALWE